MSTEQALFTQELEKSVDPKWEIHREGYKPEEELSREVINSLANGYMGVRPSIAEQKKGIHQPANYIAGLFEEPRPSQEAETASPVPDLVRIPDWMMVDFHNGEGWFNIDQAHLLSYNTRLNMENGVLTYNLRWEDQTGKITAIKTTRFLSQDNQHIGALRYAVTPENYSGEITLRTGINGQVDNKGEKYLEEESKGELGDSGIYYAARTKNHRIALASKVNLSEGTHRLEIKPRVVSETEKISQELTVMGEAGKTYTLDKIVGVYSSIDQGQTDPVEAAKGLFAQRESFDELRKNHSEAWAEKWQKADVVIDGNMADQGDVRFILFKLMQLARDNGGQTSIAAKGLDNLPGEGYKGHVFWDTEIFMLPFYIHAEPEIARSLLMYRYNRLNGAREKAKEYGYEGALFPWESADSGKETTPRFIKSSSGKLIDIYTGEREFHISADIAYAVWEYYLATGDKEFLQNYGAEMIAETARFWVSKAEYNKDEDRYEIKEIIGPDEYHEKAPNGEVGVDNNYYTNAMAQWNIRKALDIWKQFSADPTVAQKMGLNDEDVEKWFSVADQMYIPFDPETKLHPQFDGYMDLQDLDLDLYQGVCAMDAKLRSEGKDPNKFKVIKQADTLLAEILLKEDDPAILMANYDFYSRRCSHGSSLSDATHAVMASRLGDTAMAYDQFKKSKWIDLGNSKGNNDCGTHTAALGGVWQTMVYGFGGVQLKENCLALNPHLPPRSSGWQGLKFNLRYGGQELQMRVGHNNLNIKLGASESSSIPVEIKGHRFDLMPGENYTFSLPESTQEGMNPNVLLTSKDKVVVPHLVGATVS